MARFETAEKELEDLRTPFREGMRERRDYLYTEAFAAGEQFFEAQEALRIHETGIDVHASIAGGAL